MKSIIFSAILMMSLNANAITFTATNDGPITGYFVGSTADYSSRLSLSINGQQSHSYIHDHLSSVGDRVIFGFANSGDKIVFNLDVESTGDVFYSDKSMNHDGIQHISYQEYEGNSFAPSGLYVGFEDVVFGGDLDFNDNSVVFENISAPVPEPESYLMTLIGLIVISLLARKRKLNGAL